MIYDTYVGEIVGSAKPYELENGEKRQRLLIHTDDGQLIACASFGELCGTPALKEGKRHRFAIEEKVGPDGTVWHNVKHLFPEN